jgi:hypothetical protein
MEIVNRRPLRDATGGYAPKKRPKPRARQFDCPCGCGRRSAFTQPRSLRFVAAPVTPRLDAAGLDAAPEPENVA